MNTIVKKLDSPQRFFNLLVTFALAVSLFVPMGEVVNAQSENPQAPLSPDLLWTDYGGAERAFLVNGEYVTLSGNLFRAVEEFGLDLSHEVAEYYSTINLAELGWEEVSTTPYSNGISSIYFHPAGIFVQIEFFGCKTESDASCLTVWESDPVTIMPDDVSRVSPEQQALGTLSKSSPANNSTNIDTNVTLTWAAYSGTGLSRYRYCIDKTDNSKCDSSVGWTTTWSEKSANVTSLEAGTKYYWQVQAVLNDDTKVDANNGAWWSFTTKVQSPPGSFSKTLPLNGATGQSITPVLVWQASSNATDYTYCIDTTNNNICDSNWVSTSNKTFVTLLSGIGANITYYWQVRGVNSSGVYTGDGGAWSSFTTASGPANDTIAGAYVVGVPYENVGSTTSATIDGGTTNVCSSALGFSSVWYKYTPLSNRKIYLDTFGTNYDTVISVWTKNANETLNSVICNDDSTGVSQSSINLQVTNGTTYYIQVLQKNPGSIPVSSPGGALAFHIRNFADVLGNNGFWKYIEGIYAAGITGGCATSPDLLYCPKVSVDRAAMAVFLLKSIHGSAYIPPAVGADTGFLDVPVNHWAAAWIKQLAAEGITSGCSIGYYCPDVAVTRAQMAVFLLRSVHGAGYTPPAVGIDTGFSDVPTTYWAAAWIKQLASEGITSGCGGGQYCPETNVTREQMAVFLSKAFGISMLP
ncbi:MAG: hypothetical protein C3F07_13640 [Anaerolineales bacterium]|nr:hypothetical protein [Anaerolineae bacterium]PWB71622.1 MAG: hypothetical protein C3F07_13640 [Anaerolineales bacterium]